MASLVVITLVVALAGVVFGAYITICLAIIRDDRVKGALRFDPPNQSARSARDLVGLGSSRWD
jgi:hypothetical protein